jgi:hypothetical protein
MTKEGPLHLFVGIKQRSVYVCTLWEDYIHFEPKSEKLPDGNQKFLASLINLRALVAHGI